MGESAGGVTEWDRVEVGMVRVGNGFFIQKKGSGCVEHVLTGNKAGAGELVNILALIQARKYRV